jgi:hypothetical protein
MLLIKRNKINAGYQITYVAAAYSDIFLHPVQQTGFSICTIYPLNATCAAHLTVSELITVMSDEMCKLYGFLIRLLLHRDKSMSWVAQ